MKATAFHAMILTAVLAILGLSMGACDSDDVKDSLQQTYEYTYETDPLTISDVSGTCLPAPALDTLLSQIEQWAEIRDRVDKIEVRSVYYQITENQTPADGVIRVQAADSIVDVLDALDVLETQIIQAQTAYTEWTRTNFLGDGKAVLEGYLNAFDEDFALCGLFDPPSGDVNLTLRLQFNIDILYTPL